MKKFQLLLILQVVSFSIMAQLPTNGLVFHYPMNGDLIDATGNGYNGTAISPILDSDRFGNSNSAYTFNGTSDYIELPSSSALKPDFPFTVSLWFERLGTSINAQALYASDASFSAYSGFWVSHLTSDQIIAGYGNGLGVSSSHRKTKHSNTLISSNGWYHIIAVFNELNDIDLYINCELDPGYYSGSSSSMIDQGLNGSLGRRQANDHHNGSIDDVRLYDRALTAEEIKFLCYESPCIEYVTVYDTIIVYDTLVIASIQTIDPAETSGITIYPNPSLESFTVKIEDSLSDKMLDMDIINSGGQIIHHSALIGKLNEFEASIVETAGVYFVKITDGSGVQISVKKLVVKL